ncbi:hypothetical protein [Vibrio porteresiae]|uniref:Nitrate/nitrite sensing protein domain-containing protein n=1 Tax=Vibrio porteresiae DSM 19223 TaxID=1123496 RepID=A0ABZ0QCL5_9VIBR|nr:hypothetical protein [Vibrio porteresiae]WPC73263.1 hypothetical protein R8Z52_14210 [Vibrio porteresiae DSM 19223]
MFVLLSMIISLAILGLMFFYAKQRESSAQRKYDLIVDLRELLVLCRQHRSATHHVLMFDEDRHLELNELQQALMNQSQHLIGIAHFDNKPMYRILQRKLDSLTSDWQERSIARNQIVHGKAIRHCMFLLDEVMLAWLVESGREELSDEYHINWQQIIDAMDALTQLRICIEDLDSAEGRRRFAHYVDTVQRKINQLSIISALTIASPGCTHALEVLSDWEKDQTISLSTQELYAISSTLSLTIAHVYDHMLSELLETLYQPLPKLLIA